MGSQFAVLALVRFSPFPADYTRPRPSLGLGRALDGDEISAHLSRAW